MSGRARWLLAVLLLLSAAGLWWRLAPGDDDTGILGGRTGRKARAAAAPTALVDLRVDRLAQQPGTYEVGRDPFRFGPPPAPPGPSPEELARLEREARERERRMREEAEARERWARDNPPPPPKPVPPTFGFSYLGSFGPASRRVAVFSDGKEIRNAIEGDVLDGEFVVSHIGFESVDIRYRSFPDAPALRLPISGSKGV